MRAGSPVCSSSSTLGLFLLCGGLGHAQVLYDPADAPNNRLIFLSVPFGGTHSTLSTDGGVALLVSDRQHSELAGLTANPFAPLPELSRDAGVELQFELQLLAESHGKTDDNRDGKDDRSGLSVLLLDRDRKGIELAFWANRIWAQDDGKNLFSQAEGAAAETTSMLFTYSLQLEGEKYRLSRGGKVILEGRVRDYTTFRGSPNVYQTANFVFLGDDTTRGGAKARIGRVVLRRSVGF